ncbi:MAG TPA: hypothetical protein ENL35_09510 [Chloroflexi bacterium]|nr:hypothetical protein [Chloroflexota bacterium]
MSVWAWFRRISLGFVVVALAALSLPSAAIGGPWPGASEVRTLAQAVSTFSDVPADHWAYNYIEALYRAGYVAGCGTNPLRYCPDRILTRAESSVFILRGAHGAHPDPPYPAPQNPTFADVDPSYWGYGWIESLWQDGYTAGCNADPLMYCPAGEHTRAEASVFFLRIKLGVDYQPPPAQGLFADVEPGAWYAGWVEAAYAEGLLPACASNPLRFCPQDLVDRSWAAYMMVQAKGLSLPEEPAQEGWFQEAHDPAHSGYTPEVVPASWQFKWQWNGSCADGRDCRPGDPELGWSFEIPPKSHPVAGNGRLYLPAGVQGVWAIRESDGKTDWHNAGVQSEVTAAFDPDEDTLFVASTDGKLYKLSSFDGSVVGQFQADGALNLAPVIVGGRVYVVSAQGTLYAVDKTNMQRVWSYTAGSPGQTPPAYSARYQVLVFGTEDLFVHGVNASDGSRRWRIKPTVNEPGPLSYDGGDGRRHRTYNYEHGWPVIAEEHGIVFMRLRLPKSAIWQVPNPQQANWFPSSNSAIRDFLTARPELQTLFALRLDDGNQAFIPAVGAGNIETPDIDATLGPLPVVRRLGNGGEVAYVVARNGQKCEAGDCEDPRWDAVMCEMVLDDQTIPGLQEGDCRIVGRDLSRNLITDEMGKISMAGDVLFHAHWLSLQSHRIRDRSDSLGLTYLDPIATQELHPIVNRASNEPDWVTCQPTPSHYCSTWIDTYGDNRAFEHAFWLFFNDSDPPYAACRTGNCVAPYSDGYKARYAIVNNGTAYYESNGGTIFAVGAP